MPVNPRKDAFKSTIMERMRSEGARSLVPKDDLIAAVRAKHPDMCDDAEACYDGCKNKHPKWRHEFDRSLYDLTATRPPKIQGSERARGHYLLY